ncbi:MAG TPA: ParB N-terminal domain-containing protein [Gemmatimonadales bacterium]|jgi:ParB family chromosome partitioning protein|nr:ParB N-terminal domain-containing protein [Gemmatimonadales bacterium]
MAEKSTEKKPRRRRKGAAVEPRGLTARQVGAGVPPAELMRLMEAIEADGGAVIGPYREPLGGLWQVMAALPVDLVEPTPYQRDLSAPHVARLMSAIEKLGRFVDPIIVVRTEEGKYWTPNGNHRLAALKGMGARSVVALVVPEREVAHRILILNTEKAHNVRERALEAIRLAQALAELEDRPEREYATELEEPALVTLGLCYLEQGRFSGGAYHPVLRRTEKFGAAKLSNALAARRERAVRLLELDAVVATAVQTLRERGLESPYLKAFVLARINPLRFKRGATADPDEVIAQMLTAAKKFDAGKVRPDQVARAGGVPDES